MNKIMKNAYLISHKYAPELNKVILKNGLEIKAANINTLEKFKCLFKPAKKIIKRVKVEVKHSIDEHKSCDRFYTFGAMTYKRIKESMVMIKQKHNLNDAEIKILSIETVFI